jgi:hypothetical protein
MVREVKPPLADVKAEAQRVVEQTMEQARSAVDNYFTFVQKIISSYPSGGTELGEKLKSSAQKNLAVTYEFVQKLSHAKNFNDIIRIQTEFVQTQLESFGEQAKSIGEAVGFKAATWYERRNTDTD